MTEPSGNSGPETRGERRRAGTAVAVSGILAVFVLVVTGVLVWPMMSPDSAVVDASVATTAESDSDETSAAVDPEEPVSEPVTVAPDPWPEKAEALSPIPPTILESVPDAGRQVALTFDLCERDGDVAGFDEGIIAVLRDTGTPATFFMGGKWAESHPDAARMLGEEELFEIGNHSWSHVHFEGADVAVIDEQIVKAQDEIARLTGYTPRLFRFPFGTYDSQSLQRVGDHGLVAIQWDVVTGDPDPNIDASDIQRAIRNGAGPGSIVIMHANGRGWNTADALPGAIEYLRQQGFELTTVGALLGQQ